MIRPVAMGATINILQLHDSRLFNDMSTPLAFGLGNFAGMDGLLILIVLLLLFGAKKLPELARGLGQSLNEFKKARDDFDHELRAGQQDPQAREAANRQPYQSAPAAVPTQSLPHATSPEQSPEALQQQVEKLQAQLRALEAQKSDSTPVG